MNYITGLFLNYMTEEDAFWSLRQIMENTPYRMNKWFNQELTMVHTSHYQVLAKHENENIDGKIDREVFAGIIFASQRVVHSSLHVYNRSILEKHDNHLCSGLCVFSRDPFLMMWLFVFGIFSSPKAGRLYIKFHWHC